MDCLHTDVIQDDQYFTRKPLVGCLICGQHLALDYDNIYKEVDIIQSHAHDIRIMGDDLIMAVFPLRSNIEIRFRYERRGF